MLHSQRRKFGEDFVEAHARNLRREIDATSLGLALLSMQGYDPVFGARPLKRFHQRYLLTRLASSLIAGEVTDDSQVKFTVKDDALVMK